MEHASQTVENWRSSHLGWPLLLGIGDDRGSNHTDNVARTLEKAIASARFFMRMKKKEERAPKKRAKQNVLPPRQPPHQLQRPQRPQQLQQACRSRGIYRLAWQCPGRCDEGRAQNDANDLSAHWDNPTRSALARTVAGT